MGKKKGWFYLVKKLFVSEPEPKQPEKVKTYIDIVLGFFNMSSTNHQC